MADEETAPVFSPQIWTNIIRTIDCDAQQFISYLFQIVGLQSVCTPAVWFVNRIDSKSNILKAFISVTLFSVCDYIEVHTSNVYFYLTVNKV